MSATKEQWKYGGGERVWAGTYRNSQNTLHWHSDCEFICVRRGAATVVCDGVTYKPTEGDAMFIDSECLHRINADTPDTLIQTLIFDRKIINDFAGELALTAPVLSNDYGAAQVYAQTLKELTEKGALYSYRADARVRQLMLDVFACEQTENKKSKSKTDEKLRALFAEIYKHYDSYTLDDAARFMGMNSSYLSRFFTARTGMHFMRYVNAVKVEKAVEMLSRGENNVTEVADKCGFGTIRNFNRIFKLLTGYSPSSLPDDYTFTAAATESDDGGINPTLFDCELIECSSVR